MEHSLKGGVNLNIPVIVGALAFMGLIVGIGFWSGLNVKSSKSFFLGGGSQGFFPIIATQAATSIGGGCMIGWAGFGYTFGFGVAWYGIVCIIGLAILVFTVASFFQKNGFYTIPDWLCHSLGEDKFLRGIAALLAMWMLVGAWAGNAVATGTIVNQLTGLPVKMGALIGGLLVLGYCSVGGLQSVIKVDMFNFVILWLGVIILIPATLIMAGGFSNILASNPVVNHDIWPGMKAGLGWFIAVTPGMMTMQTAYQRFSASKNEKVAKWGIYGTIISIVIIVAYASITGMAIRTINPEIARGQMAVPWFVVNKLNPVFAIFILGGILAALFSTSDSVLNSASANIAKDFYAGIFNPKATDKDMLRAGRIATIVIGIVGIAIALYIPYIMKLLIAGYGVSAGGLLFPIFLAHYWKRTTRNGALAGMIGGFIIAFPGAFIPSVGKVLSSYFYNPILAALMISLILTVIVSLGTKKEKEPVPSEAIAS